MTDAREKRTRFGAVEERLEDAPLKESDQRHDCSVGLTGPEWVQRRLIRLTWPTLGTFQGEAP